VRATATQAPGCGGLTQPPWAATAQTAPLAATGAPHLWEGLWATTYGTPRCGKPRVPP
jgi:hypothetical protein